MKIKQIISLILATSILVQSTAIVYGKEVDETAKTVHAPSEYFTESISDNTPNSSITESNDLDWTVKSGMESNHRKRLDPKVRKYTLPAIANGDIRVIVTQKHESILSEKNYQSASERINASQTALNSLSSVVSAGENDIQSMLKSSDKVVEIDNLVYKNSVETPEPTLSERLGVMIGNFYPESFGALSLEEYHDNNILGNDIKIAILDTGLNYKSTELNIYGGTTFVDGSESWADDDGHGTAMAGIIGAAMDNEGLTGIAPNAMLYSVKVLDADGIGYISSVVKGIEWAIENKMDIIYFGFSVDQYSYALENAVNNAFENNILMVAPAGNSGNQNVCYPAGLEHVISVGSLDEEAGISSFSNRGTSVDFYAPGESIESILYANNKPTLVSGTSASAAQVAGMAALLLEENGSCSIDDLIPFFAVRNDSSDQEPSLNTSPHSFMSQTLTAIDLYNAAHQNAQVLSTAKALTAPEPIALNKECSGTLTRANERKYYQFTITHPSQAVTFLMDPPTNKVYRIFYQDSYSQINLNVTDQTLVLPKGTYTFYVCGQTSSDYSSQKYYLKLETTKSTSAVKEYLQGHGVDPTSGNFTYTFDDLTSGLAGEIFKIQRSYNSRDLTQNHFNTGWTFNFEGKAEYLTLVDGDTEETQTNKSIIAIRMPDGTNLHFEEYIYDDGQIKFFPMDSRAKLKRNEDSKCLSVTTPDQTKYFFNPVKEPSTSQSAVDAFANIDSPGCLYKIVDKYGNSTDINWHRGKITDITDAAGNTYTFTYDSNKLISISDAFGRSVTYIYNGGTLIQSTDSTGQSYYYSYGTYGLLTEIKNDLGTTIASVTYAHPDALRYKVDILTDQYGTQYQYDYDTINNKTSITAVFDDEDQLVKITKTNYDAEHDITYYVDEAGYQSSVEYYYQQSGGSMQLDPDGNVCIAIDDDYRKWKNGEILKSVDKTGLITSYTYPKPYDDTLGLPIAKTVSTPNGNMLEYTQYSYDTAGNVITEKNWREKESDGTGTYTGTNYIYENRVRLVQVQKYLPVLSSRQSLPEMTDSNANDFAVTNYEYVTDNPIKGLVGKIVYPEQYTGNSADKGWVYTYDSKGNLTSVTNPESTAANEIKETFEYNNFGWVSKHVSGEGTVTEYEYNNNGQETKRTCIASTGNEVTRTVYNTLGLPVQTISPMQYNSSFETADGGYSDLTAGERKEYYENGLLKKVTDPEGNITSYTYDSYGEISQITRADGVIEGYYRQNYSNTKCYIYIREKVGAQEELKRILLKEEKISLTAGYTNKYEYTYYSDSPEYTSVYNLYDFRGNLYKRLDSYSGHDTTLIQNNYDLSGNLIEEASAITSTDFALNFYSYGYDTNTHKTYVEKKCCDETSHLALEDVSDAAKYRYTKTSYDKNGNAVQTLSSTKLENASPNLTNDSTVTETREYYADNLLKSETDAMGIVTAYEYDKDRKLNRMTVKDGTTVLSDIVYENNHYGKPVSIKTYDKKGNLTGAAFEQNGISTQISSYTYDAKGNLLTQTDGNNHTTTLVYDSNNRLMTQYADGGLNTPSKTDSYKFDSRGNLTEHTDRNGKTTVNTYDVFDRLILTACDGESTAYTYDGNGNILTMTDSSGVTTYTYDSMGRILTQNHSVTGTVTYTYDNYTNIPYGLVSETTTDPKGHTVEKWYDAEDKIYKVIDSSLITEYTYYDNNVLHTVKAPDGTISTHTYDAAGNLIGLETKTAADSVIASYTYTYSDGFVGGYNQISKTETKNGASAETTAYEYDAQGRLIKVTHPSGTVNAYTYDTAGNRLSKVSSKDGIIATNVYSYDEQNRLTETVAATNGSSAEVHTYFGYDNNGNQISKWVQSVGVSDGENSVTLGELGVNAAGDMALYSYDNFNRLTGILQGNTTIQNAYNGRGQKISRTTDGETRYYVYDGNTVIAELDGQNELKARNVYGRNLISRTKRLFR